MAVFRNERKTFSARLTRCLPPVRDQTTVQAGGRWRGPALLERTASYERRGRSTRALRFDLKTEKLKPARPDSPRVGRSRCGINGDDNLALFVGGQVVPVVIRRRPTRSSSKPTGTGRLMTKHPRARERRSRQRRCLERPDGTVAGTDSRCEWGPLKIFRNDNGKTRGMEPESPLLRCRGESDPETKPENSKPSVSSPAFGKA
jgi:hypothetical protein